MTPAHLVRTARRIAGVSQRELAARAGVATRTVADVERGATSPNVATLERLLDAAGTELTLDRQLPPPCHHLTKYLRFTLTQRLYLAFGGITQPNHRGPASWVQLWDLVHVGRVEVIGPAAVGVWSPLVAERPTARVHPHPGKTVPPSTDELEIRTAHEPIDRACVPIAFQVRPVRVLPPALLALTEVDPGHRLALRVAAELLDRRGSLDRGDRRAAAHRDVDPHTDEIRVMHTKSLGHQPVPPPYAGRGWQLGGPVSLSQWFERQGLRP